MVFEAENDIRAPEMALPSGAPFHYSLYGLRVRSDIWLALPQADAATNIAPDCILRMAEPGDVPPEPDGRAVAGLPCHGPCHNGRMVTLVHRGHGGTWFWHDSVATCHVLPDARRVDIYPDPERDERALVLMLIGQVMTFVLHKLGYPSLHASAVATEFGAAAFLGHMGQGKSTMAAHFLRRGATLLTDDVLPLRVQGGEVYGGPSVPMMKVWSQTAERALGLSEELPNLAQGYDKKLLTVDGQYPLADTPVRLRRVYLLNRYDPEVTGSTEITIQGQNGLDSLATLLRHTSNRAYLQPAENAILPGLYSLLMAKAPVQILSYPSGFDYQPAIYARIMAELEAR